MVQYGRTEWLKNTLNPKFTTTFQMDYHFEQVQQLQFSIYDIDNSTDTLSDDDFLGSIECNLGEVGGWQRELNGAVRIFFFLVRLSAHHRSLVPWLLNLGRRKLAKGRSR